MITVACEQETRERDRQNLSWTISFREILPFLLHTLPGVPGGPKYECLLESMSTQAKQVQRLGFLSIRIRDGYGKSDTILS